MKTPSVAGLAMLGFLIGSACVRAAVPARAVPTYTSVQASSGQAAYARFCARCHGANLDDGEFGPPLRGKVFVGRWRGRSLAELDTLVEKTMPPDSPGSLSDRTYTELLAFLLAQAGVSASDVELSSERTALATQLIPAEPGALDLRAALGPSGGLAPGTVLPAWPAKRSVLETLTPVTDAMLQSPADADWLTWRQSFADAGFSPLTQVNKGNVGTLRLAWALALPAGPNEATPLVHDGVLFVHAYNDHVLALNAATGDELWHYARRLPAGITPSVQRNIALYADMLYLGTSDSHVVALNTGSGRVVWDQPIADPQIWRVSGGPLVASGKVMQGVVGRAPGGAFIVGLDAATGLEAWRFHSIAQPGQPGDASWNGTPPEQRSGGSVWTAGSYDPQLRLAFFGPAQTYDTAVLQQAPRHSGVSNDGLYLDSTVALDPATGRLAWYFQHLPNDQWDYDWAFERQIVQLPLGGKLTKLVITSGKLGIYDALDAAGGQYAFSIDLGIQNLVTSIDPKTGAKTLDPVRYPDGRRPVSVCPHPGGGRSWIPGSYNPHTHVVYLPMVESCMEMIPLEKGEHGPLSSGYRWSLRPRPDSDGKYGRIQAVNLATRKTVWVARQRAPQSSGVLDTAGGVLFAGALDRWFSAYDDASGKLLWQQRLSDVPSSAPISFAAHGKQYIAMVVGYGGPQTVTFRSLVPEIPVPPARSSSIWVFELPKLPAPGRTWIAPPSH
jgi:alcohol dehydrogenase (cytochrome c)